jgi:ribosomal protein S24E
MHVQRFPVANVNFMLNRLITRRVMVMQLTLTGSGSPSTGSVKVKLDVVRGDKFIHNCVTAAMCVQSYQNCSSYSKCLYTA